MSLLSDSTIRDEIAKGNLIVGADPQFVSQCSYAFRVGKIFSGGEKGLVTDWTTAAPHVPFLIQPGAMGWVRMREQVKLPPDICATWLQTNTLSRQGIMLVNMSIVDPGYEGALACLFVNFGRNIVNIDDATPIAKLTFQRVDKVVSNPASYLKDLPTYDRELQGVAVNGGGTFLRLDQLSTELDVKRKEIVESITKAVDEQKKQALDDIVSKAPWRVGAAYAVAVAGFALLVTATTFVPWLQSEFHPNLRAEITDAIDEHLRERAAPLPAALQLEMDQLKVQNAQLRKELDALKAQKH